MHLYVYRKFSIYHVEWMSKNERNPFEPIPDVLFQIIIATIRGQSAIYVDYIYHSCIV